MRILLTGHKGFIGQNAYRKFKDIGHDVVGFDWQDSQNMPSLDGIDLVVHMGAISSTAEKNVEKVFLQNYDFSVELIDRCVSKDIPMHISSSGAVYGRGSEFTENSPVFPMSPYAWSKYMVEKYCRKYPEASIKLMRYFNVYSSEGETESHKTGQCSPHYKFRKQAEEHNRIELFVHPVHRTSFRDFISVNDVVDYHVKFFNSDAKGIFNIGTGNAKSFEDVAKEISKEYNAEIVELPMPEDMASYIQWYTCADTTKLKDTLQ
jgi:ADP-L-glycero-D-manno-heptose 6-epimerase